MELVISLIGILLTMFGGFLWLGITLGNLKGRLDTLEGKKHFERAEQEFTQKLEALIDAAQQRLNNELNPERMVQQIEIAQQRAVQHIEELLSNFSGLKTALQELEVAKQRALDEITQASSSERLLAIEQQINQSVEEFRSKITAVVNQADARRLALEHDAGQFLVKVQKQLANFEQQREQIISEIAQMENEPLKKLKTDVERLKLSVVISHDPATLLAETLPEITFETAFIDNNKNIRRETRKARQLVEILPNNVKLEMIYIPGGTFMMGSNENDDEKPIHPVTLQPFFVGKYPVTQAQWEAIMGSNPSKFKGANRPVETVTWNEAKEFCKKLSQQLGEKFDLLSEAQWEYACRAGNVTRYSFGEIITPALANYDASGIMGIYYIAIITAIGKYHNASGIKQTTDVGKYPANGFGLYDMHGNVREWCEDVWHDNYNGAPRDGSAWMAGGDSNKHLIRGGSWSNYSEQLRCANRSRDDATNWSNVGGFRIFRVNL